MIFCECVLESSRPRGLLIYRTPQLECQSGTLMHMHGYNKPRWCGSKLKLVHDRYSLCPKMIVLLPGFFCPKMIVRFIFPSRNLLLKVKYFTPNFHHQEVFRHCNFGGRFGIVVVFYCYSVNGGLNPSKVMNTEQLFWDGGILDSKCSKIYITFCFHLTIPSCRKSM